MGGKSRRGQALSLLLVCVWVCACVAVNEERSPRGAEELERLSREKQVRYPKPQVSAEEYESLLRFDPEDPYFVARKKALAFEASKLRKPVPTGKPYNVTYDGRSLFIDGERRLLVSGSIHYPRSSVGMWPLILNQTKAAGVDVVETYVFWNVHEPIKGGPLNFEDNADLMTFLELCQQNDLYVNLRIGPYVCAEWNFGGFPFWLRQEPGMVFRDNNKPFMNEMAAWMATVVDIVKPMLASNGGPIILAQVENEYGWLESIYGLNGTIYANWSIAYANSLDIGIPWIMCQQNNEPAAINTCNGFYCDSWLSSHWQTFPDQPAFWTENWGGWFQHWGEPIPKRPVEELSYAIVRWYAQGGSLMNYYMWFGGTNFDRWVGGPFIVSSYDYDVMLNEYGLPSEPKYSHLSALHQVLHDYEVAILSQPPAMGLDISGNSNVLAYVYNNASAYITFIINWTPNPHNVVYGSKPYYLTGWSAVIVADGELVYNTSNPFFVTPKTPNERKRIRSKTPSLEAPPPSGPSLLYWAEPPAGSATTVTNETPLEQLDLTQDLTDYLWYTTSVVFPESFASGCYLFIENTGDVTHVFVDGLYIDTRVGHGLSQNWTLLQEAGNHTIQILTAGMGLENYGEHMEQWKLGLLGSVDLGDGNTWLNLTSNTWEMKVGLLGESLGIINGSSSIDWSAEWKQGLFQPLSWFQLTFDLPSSMASSNLLAIDAVGMNKGQLYLNGRGLGRYWTSEVGTQPQCSSGCSLTEEYNANECRVNCGEPSQRYFHVPTDWLLPTNNRLVFFEEIGGDPSAVQLVDLSVNSTICSFVKEWEWIAVGCPPGSVVTSVDRAFFGNPPNELCGLNVAGSCNAEDSVSILSQNCLNRSYCYIQASIDVFGDPCPGTSKSLSVQFTCSSPYS